MHLSTKVTLVFIFIYLSWNFYLQFELTNRFLAKEVSTEELDNRIKAAENRLGQILKNKANNSEDIKEKISNSYSEKKVRRMENQSKTNIWKEPIHVIVFSCDRPMSLRLHLEKLIKYRPSKDQFPITVSQDCDNDNVAKEVMKFGKDVEYVKHSSGISANLTIPPNHKRFKTYYYISRHYKLALNHIFSKNNHSSVILTEDDLDIAPDFFSFFSSTRHLLDEDRSLWCVTAWNDNGKLESIDSNANETLYRSDFFAGLGWMMTKKTWEELEPTWPNGFWDDWMRDPLRRKNRQCIRPEISRTGMMKYGKNGASTGQFFEDYLAKVKVNDRYTDFSEIDMKFLLKKNFEKRMKEEVLEEAVLMDISNITSLEWKPKKKETKVRIMYDGRSDFINKAKQLQLMYDFKAGVPRTAYNGIVTCFSNGHRIFLVPDRTKVLNYDISW